MNPVKPALNRILIVYAATILAGLAGTGTLDAQDRRIMVGESIHIRAGESVPEAACVACSIHIDTDGVVTGDAVVVLGSLENRGRVEGDTIVIGGAIESWGTVLGKSVVIGGNMRLLSDIAGDAIAILGSIDTTSSEALIGGDAVLVIGRQSGLTQNNVEGSIEDLPGGRFGTLLLSGLVAGLTVTLSVIFATLLALNALGYLILGSRRTQTVANTLKGNALACLAGGTGTCLVLIAAALMLAILFPVAIPILAVLAVMSVIGYCGVTFFVGRNLFPKRSEFVAMLLAGAVVIAIQLIPVVGWLILIVVWNIAVGATVLSGFGTSTDWLARRTSVRKGSIRPSY